MRRLVFLFVIPLLVTSVLYVTPRGIPIAHGAALVGEVCIARAGNTACPVAPPLINSTVTLPPPQLRLAIVINDSAALNTFDITLLTDSAILKPAGATLTGSVINGTGASVTPLSKCIGDVGFGCASTDNKNTLHYSISSTPGTGSMITGLLFTAIYNVTGTAANSPIGFQTGCVGTSISGGVCISIQSGTTAPDPETFQVAKFTDQPYFDLQPSPRATLTIPEGSTDSLALNLTSVNNFVGTVSIASNVFPSTPPAPTLMVSPTTVQLNASFPTSFSNVVVTVGASVPPGSYILNFTATSGTLPPNILVVTLTVPPKEFAISVSPGTLTFNVTMTSSSTIRLTSLANFAGMVNLTLASPAGLNASLLRTRLNVAQASSNTTTLTVRSMIAGSYSLNVTGTSGSLTHTTTVRIIVQDFTMSVSAGALILAQSTRGTQAVNFGSPVLYNTTVTVAKIFINQITSSGPIGPSTGISVVCNPLKVILNNTGTGENIVPSNCQVVGVQIGNYTVTVVGVSGPVSHAVTFPVQVVGPDFIIVASQTVQTVPVGKSATLNVTVTRELGLNSTITLSAQFPQVGNPASPPSVAINVQQVMLNATYHNANATVTVTTGASAPTGIYSLALTALATSSGISHTVNVIIVITTTTSPHDLAVDSVTASPTSATVGSSISITIVVKNLGKVTENSTVLAIAGDLSVDQKNVTIAPGGNVTVTLTWNTNGFNSGAYMVGGKVLGVPGETILSNNLLRSATPVTLAAANTSVLQSPYFQPAIIAALIIIVGIVAVMFLQARRRNKLSQPPAQVQQ